jgi:hypothetical protein
VKTHKRYIDYVITMISTSSFYISKTSFSLDADLIATDTTTYPSRCRVGHLTDPTILAVGID